LSKDIFRKSAIDKVRSPEQLHDYMKVIGTGVWLIIGGIFIVFAAFFIWGFMGSIPETTEFTGTALITDNGEMIVYSYVTIDDARRISEGMDVRISPDYAPKEQYGYIFGTVACVGETPVNTDSLRDIFGDDYKFLYVPTGNVIEITVIPNLADGKIHWSTSRGMSVDVTVGSTCVVTVITEQRRPYELFFR